MTIALAKKHAPKVKLASPRRKPRLSARARAELLVGDVYRDGKRIRSGPTVFQVLASRKKCQADNPSAGR